MSDDATDYQISQLSYMLEEIDIDVNQRICHKDSKLLEVYNQGVRSMIERMLLDDIYGVYLVYDTFDKVIRAHEAEENFCVCYNYLELMKLIHKEYKIELELFIEIIEEE
jgi:hypothetical protein